jgi:hypothetical protein
VFFVEARYHHNPKRAGDQVRYIAHREVGLQGGDHRELHGIGARYQAFRGDERLIRKALMDDGRGLRNPVYFRFILTVDNPTAERFARLDVRLVERALRDAVRTTFRGAARGAQGVFAIHQHGGQDRAAHPHVHALLSPRLESGAAVHISPIRLQRVKERWEGEVLRALDRQERRLNRSPQARDLPPLDHPRERAREKPVVVARPRRARRTGPVTLAFVRFRKGLRMGRLGADWASGRVGLAGRLQAFSRSPERVARRATFHLFTAGLPAPIRAALWASRGLRVIGVRPR